MLLEEYMDNYKTIMLNSIHTQLPGKIISFDGERMEATVVLLARTKIGGVYIEPQEIERCPVVFTNDSTFSIRHPFSPGDLVMVGFSENSLENLLSTGEVVDVITEEKFNVSDAVILGGLITETTRMSSTDTDGLLIINKKTGHKVVFKSDGSLDTTCEIINAPQATITCKKVIATEQVQSPTVTAQNSLTISGKEMKEHKHTGVQGGSGISGPPQ